MVDDGAFHLICMPFWGGATLAAVLAAARAHGPARRHPGATCSPISTRVAAPEYPAVHPARPAREILAGLSYDQALAWVGARLAEALDHAFGRDVAHGDVKPSNILLSADGNPMLLDFNLARDDVAVGSEQRRRPGRNTRLHGAGAVLPPWPRASQVRRRLVLEWLRVGPTHRPPRSGSSL